MPVGSIRPFCEPATTTSTPHSSMRKSIDARDEITSTRNNAGCPAASIARRSAAMSWTTPVEVSLCTTSTAFDRVPAILAQPGFERGRVGGVAPIVGQGLDLEPERLAAHAPIQRKIAGLDDQHLVAGREQVDECGFPGAVTGGGIAEDGLLGLEDPLQAGEAFFGNGLELRAGEIDRPAVHRPQNAVRDIGRTGILKKMQSATDGHLRSPLRSCAWSPMGA